MSPRSDDSAETAGQRVVANLSVHEKRNFSYVRLINFLASERRNDTCLESDVSNALAKVLPMTPEVGAAYVPLSLEGQRSGLDSKSGSAGGFTAGLDVTRDVIELLRGRNLLLRLGGTLLSLDHARAMPVQTAASTATWVSENSGSDVDESDMAFGARIAYPHSLILTTSFSKKLLSQTGSGTAEAIVRADLARAIGSAIDAAGFNGSGLQNEPVGILNTELVGAVIGGADGGVPDFENILDLEYAVATANADVETMAHVSTPGIRKLLKKTPEVSGSSKMIWTGNVVNGYRAEASTNVPSTLVKGQSSSCHAILLGDFSQVIVAQFGGGMAIVADPYKLKRRAMIELTCYIDVDIVVRRPESFAVMVDAKLS